MNKTNEFSPEVPERAARLVQEHRGGSTRAIKCRKPNQPPVRVINQTVAVQKMPADPKR